MKLETLVHLRVVLLEHIFYIQAPGGGFRICTLLQT
jgi:hypothetical protein